MTKKLTICVVGAGDMGLRHLKAWQNIENCEVVALVDDVPARLQEAATNYKVVGFSDYQMAIDNTKPAAVSVCVPTAFHAPISLYALEHGAHVLCEKPIALNLEDAHAMLATAQHNGLLLTVGFMLRYSPAFAKLKEWLAADKIGRPVLAVSENFMEVRPKVLMHHKKVNGGPLLDYWCHHFDMWRWLFDSEAQSIAGYGTVFASGKPEVAAIPELALDTAGVAVRFASGDIGQLATSWGLPRGVAFKELTADKFIGPEGIITGDIRRQLTLMRAEGVVDEVSNAGLNWWQFEINAFSEAVRSGATGGLVKAEDGLAALELSLAALKAIDSGTTVNF